MNLNPELLMPNAALTLGELIAAGVLTWIIIRLGGAVITALGEMEVTHGRQFMSVERISQMRRYFARLVKAAGGVAALAVVAYNAWLTASGYNGPELVIDQFTRSRQIDASVIITKLGALIGLLILVKLIAWLGEEFRKWLVERLIAAEVVRVADERVERIGTNFSWLVRSLLWLLGALLVCEIFGAPDEIVYWTNFTFALGVVWALVRLISDSLDAAVDAIYEGLVITHRLDDYTDTSTATASLVRVVTSLKIAMRWGVYIAAVAYVLRTAPLGATAYDLGAKTVRAAAIVIGAQLLLTAAMMIIARYSVASHDDTVLAARRRNTMLPLIGSLLRYLVYFVAIVMALQTMGVNVTAILAGAGVAGLAIGFGAQSLVADFISGFFTIFEGIYMVGDYVEIGGVEGTVEAITLRTTAVRSRDGRLNIIPNGEIKQVTNYSKSFVNAVVDVGVSYEGDLEKAIHVLREVGRAAREDIPEITGGARVRVTDFGGSD
ncbi:MAG: mechanosensitive ion channel family protein, partial [Armatimonadetes bacterium]|nr:mechanosensitive ion channel family protein [Armatimonadota bacterium]